MMKSYRLVLELVVLCLTSQVLAELPVPEGTIRFPGKACFGVSIHHTDNARELKALGASWIRVDLSWAGTETETKGHYAFAHFDRVVKDYTAEGMNILGLLTWHYYCDALYPKPESDADFDIAVEGFAKLAAASAKRYKGKVGIWEICNEPECFPVGKINQPERYTKLARAVAKAIRSVDPDVTVAALSVAWMDRNFIEGCLKLGLLQDGTIDAVTYHGYHRANLLPESGLADDIAWLRKQIRANSPKGKHVILIDSERGYEVIPFLSAKHWTGWRNQVYSETEQAAYLARHFLEEISLGIEVSCWYKDMGDAFAFYEGLQGSRLRPMGYVYRNMADLFDTNPKQMINRDFEAHLVDLPDEISDPNSFLKVKSYLRTYVKDEKPNGRKLIVALWNPVEAFDGKILQSRQRIGDLYYEAWRAVSEQDKVEIPVKIKLGPVESEMVSKAYVYDVSATDEAKRQTPLKLEFADDQAITDSLKIGPMPTVVVLELKK